MAVRNEIPGRLFSSDTGVRKASCDDGRLAAAGSCHPFDRRHGPADSSDSALYRGVEEERCTRRTDRTEWDCPSSDLPVRGRTKARGTMVKSVVVGALGF